MSFIEYIDKNRNCEDIAMAYIISTYTHAAPIWVRGYVEEIANNGISSGSNHFNIRSNCLDELLLSVINEKQREGISSDESVYSSRLPWVIGYQKVVPIRSTMFSYIYDYFNFLYDTK